MLLVRRKLPLDSSAITKEANIIMTEIRAEVRQPVQYFNKMRQKAQLNLGEPEFVSQ
jgi:hypothetical protein